MLSKLMIVGLALLFLSNAGASYMESTLRPSTELQRRIDADVRTSLRRFGTPGAVIAAVKDGHIIYTKSYGLRDRARNLPVLIDTPFEIGSITKQFTAAAILQLQEAGKLNIDSTVATYLSTVPHASEITLRQLLSHTSGLHDYFDAPTIDDDAVKTVTFDQLMARVADLPLDFAPGAKWSYSNTGYAMLGRIIEVTSHETYRDYVKSHLIDPVGMTHTFTVADEPKISGMSVGYRHSAGRLEAAPTISESFGWAAGNIVSTVSDLNKWNKALREGQAISKADYALMATSVSTLQGDAGYGLGLFVGEIEGEPRVGHTGGSFGFTTANEYFPKLDLQIIAFTNLGDDAPEPGEILTQIVLEDLNPNIAAAAARASPGADPAVTELVKMVFVGLQSGDEDYGSFNARLGDKLKAGLAQRLAKGFASYGPPTSAIFKGARTSIDLKWSDYLLQFGPGCSLKFSVALDAEGKVAGISFG